MRADKEIKIITQLLEIKTELQEQALARTGASKRMCLAQINGRMNDLISRKAVYEMLHGLGGCDASDEWSNGWDKAIDSAIKELDKIPTAYDVDKVVEQLKEYERYVYDAVSDEDNYVIDTEKAIEIVKGAVKDESSNISM